MPGIINIMLVDDSAVIRGILTQILEAEGDIKVIASVSNGALAVEKLKAITPDVTLLDIEMPVMDGLTALPKMLEIQPDAKILMCSTLSTANGQATMKALALGATDYVAKPSSFGAIANGFDFKDELRSKIRLIVSGARKIPATPAVTAAALTPRPAPVASAPPASASGPASNPTSNLGAPDPTRNSAAIAARMAADAPIVLRQAPAIFKPALLAIGCSTGGPRALPTLLNHLKNINIPVILTQHMPVTFTKILADQLQVLTGMKVVEAAEGDVLQAGTAYVAPGGQHMMFKREGSHFVVKLNDGPPVNFCKPAVDVMLESAIEMTHGAVLCVILTGMGSDGYAASQKLVSRGGQVIAQDKASSVVWGMPGAVATDGLCTAVLPLESIGPHIRRHFANLFIGGGAA